MLYACGSHPKNLCEQSNFRVAGGGRARADLGDPQWEGRRPGLGFLFAPLADISGDTMH